MTANWLAPQAVQDNERCRAKLEQRKQRQAQYYNRGSVDLDPLKGGDAVRSKPGQARVAERNCTKATGREIL